MIMQKHQAFAVLIVFLSLCCLNGYAVPQKKTYHVNVGVLLDDLESVEAKIFSSCLDMAVSDFYSANPHYKTRLVFKTRDCKTSVLGAATAAVDLIKNEQVQVIIGPVTSKQTIFVVNLGAQARVPIISFSATNPALTSSFGSSYFFQFSQSETFQVKAISSIVKAFGWKEVIPILVYNEYSEGVFSALTVALQKMEPDIRIPHRSLIRALATEDEIVDKLNELLEFETRVFIVHMAIDLASRLFTKAKHLGMMDQGYVWISTTELLNSFESLNASVIKAMQGVLGLQTYIPRTKKLDELKLRWKLRFKQDNPTIVHAHLDVFGFWLYDAVFAVAMAVEKLNTAVTDLGFRKSNVSIHYTTDLDNLGFSKYGLRLWKALSKSRFDGIAGSFKLVDRQLQSSTFELVNVDGVGVRKLGFWTSENGLMRELDSSLANSNSSTISTSESNIGPIIWTGESLTVPRWDQPNIGKKLKFGVPVNLDFPEFVRITRDLKTGRTNVTGGAIVEIFKAVVKQVPYPMNYELIPFVKPDGTSNGTEIELCNQVHLGNFDGVVGDTTIHASTAITALSMGFSMPFMDADLVMVVPVIDIPRKSAWVFFNPFSRGLWILIPCVYLFVSLMLWILGHPNTQYADLSVSEKIFNFVWLAIPIFYFSDGERVRNKMPTSVMAAWSAFIYALVACFIKQYADQTMKPSVTADINHLLRKGENVGYIAGAYTYDILSQAGFEDSKLKGFATMKEIDEALSKGRVAACVGETVHMRLFLDKYCNKYTIIGPVFEMMGYGFVFPKHSSLLRDISHAIINLGRADISNINKKWLGNQSSCPQPFPDNYNIVHFEILLLFLCAVSIIALICKFFEEFWSDFMDMFDPIALYILSGHTT